MLKWQRWGQHFSCATSSTEAFASAALFAKLQLFLLQPNHRVYFFLVSHSHFFYVPLRLYMLHLSPYFPITDPTLIFFVVLLIILLAPIVMGKLRIPHIIGMVLAGIVIGKYGLNILARDDSFELFGRVGLYYIMFLAALEMDLESVRKSKSKLIVFGLLTFMVPLLLTFFMSIYLLGYGTSASLLLGCIMASNTLVAYPIVSRYGLQRKASVTLSVGSSMLSFLFALILLAAIVASNSGDGDIGFWLLFGLKFVAYCFLESHAGFFGVTAML